jgi:hypothetical protein
MVEHPIPGSLFAVCAEIFGGAIRERECGAVEADFL